MDVPVEDEHLVSTIGSELCSHCDVVEEAEAVISSSMRVMTWGPDDAEPSFLRTVFVQHLTDRG